MKKISSGTLDLLTLLILKGEPKELPFSIYKLETIIEKPQEDLIHYIANYFNSQQDYFCLLIVTRDAAFQYRSISPNTLILSANWISCTNESQDAMFDADDSDTECVKLKTQTLAGMYAKEIDQFIKKYWEKAWKEDFKGDENINEEITQDIINHDNDFKMRLFSCHNLKELRQIVNEIRQQQQQEEQLNVI